MEKHIAILNKYATEKQTKWSINKQISGKTIMNTIYYQFGNYFDLPHDMCFEISSYLLYFDKHSLLYQEHCIRNYYSFLFQEIISSSLLLMSRCQEDLFLDEHELYNSWQLTHCAALYDCVFDEFYIMDAVHCYVCGNYLSASSSHFLHQRIKCFCKK
jgi:hypothetical protein